MRVTDNSPSATGRNLVPVAQHGSAGTATEAHHSRPSAAFLAQLVAIAQGAPQTRVRCRATAGDAAALYGAAARIERPRLIKVSM
jgi:hypothetical protein